MATATRLLALFTATLALLLALVAAPPPTVGRAAAPQTPRDPVDLVVVFDASGSMNWTSDGYGTLSAGSAQLGTLFDPPVHVGEPIRCADARILAQYNGCQPADAWSDYQGRRLYRTKQAVKNFLEQFPWQAQDRAAVVTFNRGYSLRSGGVPPGVDPLMTLTQVYPSDGLTTNILGPSGSGSLADRLIRQAASMNPDSLDPNALYKTFGASPGALGLVRARNELGRAPDTGPRKRYVVFFADGLLNVNLNGERSLEETLEANIGDGKPISQAIDVAATIKEDAALPASVFAVSLGSTFQTEWMPEIASSPFVPFYQAAPTLNELPDVLCAIGTVVNQGASPCAPPEATPTATATASATATATAIPTTIAAASATAAATSSATATATATKVAAGSDTRHTVYVPLVQP